MVESSEVEVDGEAVKAFAGRPFVVVGVPAFNEERTIAGVVLRCNPCRVDVADRSNNFMGACKRD